MLSIFENFHSCTNLIKIAYFQTFTILKLLDFERFNWKSIDKLKNPWVMK